MVVFDVASVKTTSIIAPGRHFSMPVVQLYLPKSGKKKYSYTENRGWNSRHSVRDWTRGVFSGLSSSCSYAISTVDGACRFWWAIFPCKVSEARSHTKNRGYSGINFAQNLPQIAHNLGIPQNFSQNFLVKATWLASLRGSKEKDSKRYAVDDDWKFETHGWLR